MNRRIFRLGGLGVMTAVVAAVLATVWLVDASAAAKPQPQGCPTDKPRVVDATANLKNGLDYGADGHYWALDTWTNTIQIWRLGGDSYCLKVHSVGTSTTIGGLSPEGTGSVRAGVTASFDGTFYQRIIGTFAPRFPTTGLIGNFDLQCHPDGTCDADDAAVPTVAQAYFSTVRHIEWGAFDFTADAGACGVWHQSSSGDTGDIVC